MARRSKLSPEPFEIRITGLDDAGFGRAELDGRSLRVRDALPGEVVRARHLFGRRFRGQAQVVEVLQASPERVTPRCPHFGTCGSCSLQHMESGAQRAFKEGVVLGELESVGLEPARVLPPLAGEAWRYRRKARLSVKDVAGKGRVLVGFRERDGRFVTDMQECHTLFGPVADALPRLSRLFDELAARAAIPQVEVTCGDRRCALVIRHMEPFGEEDQEALKAFARESGFAVYLQASGPDSVVELAGAAEPIEYGLPDEELSFTIQPMDFVQVNGELNRRMVEQAMRELELEEPHRALDLFCGMGNFTLPMARRCRSVTGVEGDENLVRRARANAERNRIANAHFERADLHGDGVAAAWAERKFDRVLLDPPRPGAGTALERVGACGASRVVYVSCNPKTLAADAARLVGAHGFSLDAAGVMDMFPHTAHVEAMAVLRRD